MAGFLSFCSSCELSPKAGSPNSPKSPASPQQQRATRSSGSAGSAGRSGSKGRFSKAGSSSSLHGSESESALGDAGGRGMEATSSEAADASEGMTNTASMGSRRGSGRRSTTKGAAAGDTSPIKEVARRRGSHWQRGGAQNVPEATPETASTASLATPSSEEEAQELLKAVLQPKDILMGVATELEVCLFGVSVPATGPRASRLAATIDPDFQEKVFESLSADAEPAAVVRERLMKEEGIAIACRKGKKAEQPNQDNFLYFQTAKFRIALVADGHGEFGHWASHWAARLALRSIVLELERSPSLPQDEVISRLFDTIHRGVKLKADSEGFDLMLSGSTLSLVIIERSSLKVLIAWCGDSRCVVGRNGPKGPETSASSNDHKPQDPEERRRIIGSGGEVVKMHDDMPHRIFVRGREAPGLAMSRAIGDLLAHSIGVVHVPSIKRVSMEAGQALLLCSDGVWEFIKNAEAVKTVFRYGVEKVGEAAIALATDSRDRWLKEEVSVTDDITVMIIWA